MEENTDPYIVDLMLKYQDMKIGVSERIYSASAVEKIAFEYQKNLKEKLRDTENALKNQVMTQIELYQEIEELKIKNKGLTNQVIYLEKENQQFNRFRDLPG